MNKLKIKYKSMPIQVKASFWFLICSFLQKGISVLTTPIFTRLLTTSEYGRYNVFNSWLGVVTIFVTMNLSFGVYTQGLVKFDKERSAFSSSLQGLTTCLVVAWTVIYILFHNFWNGLFSLSTVQMLAMLVMIWMTAIFNFWAAEQRVLYRYKALVATSLAVSLVKPLLGVFLVIHAEDKVTARILGLVFVELIAYSGLYVVQMRRGKVFFSKKFWFHALSFNLPLVPHYLSQTVLNSADRIMISNMVSDDAAGIYSLAYSIAQIMTLFNTSLMQTISPWMYQKIKDRKIYEIAPIAYITLSLIGLANIVLIALAPEVVAIFAPSTYGEAICVIPPVSMGVFFLYCYDLFAKFEFYYEKTKYVMVVSVGGAVLNIILNYIFIKLFGYGAAGYTTLVCYMLYAIGHYLFMTKVCNDYADGEQPYDLKKLVFITTIFLCYSFAFLETYRYPVARYTLIGVSMITIVIMRKKVIRAVQVILSIRKK